MNTPVSEHIPTTPAAAEPMPEPADARAEERQALEARIQSLLQQGRTGANWFFWVAGLSLVNSAIMLTGGNTFFVIGLGVTLLTDGVATLLAQENPEIGTIVRGIAFGFDVLVAALVAGFGWLAVRRYTVVFALGMVLYLLDGLLFLWFQDGMSVAFHAFALFCMWGGLRAYRQLNALENALVQQPEEVPGSAVGPA